MITHYSLLGTGLSNGRKLEYGKLTSEKEILYTAAPQLDSDDETDGDDSDSDSELEDASAEEVPALRKELEDILKDQKSVTWTRKKIFKSSYHKQPEYVIRTFISSFVFC